MALTQNELNISTLSYTNKDFESIYSELLTLAKQLSYKFDPTSSNESDAFVMLLKLLAFTGDKLNYNVDKNILERFITSATQENSVRELTDMLGYNMHYYIAPMTSVIFKYKGTLEKELVIPRYTVLTNDTKEIDYLIANEDVTIPVGTNVTSKSTVVIQGVYHKFTTLENDKVTIENLDGQYKLYFPELMVAQNGVYITGGDNLNIANNNQWRKVDNLNTETYGTKIYKFGFDSKKQLPYIQFPEWINLIIADGLTIEYVTTLGENGNVSTKTITNITFADSWSSDIDKDKLSVINQVAALNGKDQETIDEAYSGFKKTIGTFETLVTCRDFANYIYNKIFDSNNNPITSNVQVSDRRNDINYTYNTLTYTELGEVTEPIIKKKPGTLTDELNAYDLCLYPLKAVNDVSFSGEYKAKNYNESFTPAETSAVNYIKNTLENNTACLSHTYKDLGSNDIYSIKNYYKLDAIISTYDKVTKTEELSILENINKALSIAYNARKVSFGYSINDSELEKVIEKADSRIKSVNLRYPEITPYILKKDGTEVPLTITEQQGTTNVVRSSNQFRIIVCKNIFAGKVSVFEYDEEFEINYNQTTPKGTLTEHLLKNVSKFTSKANIGNFKDASGKPYIGAGESVNLYKNEVVELISNNFNTEKRYPYGINYNLVLTTGDHIPAGEIYELKGSDVLTFEWTDATTNLNIGVKYTEGDVISSLKDLYTTEYRKTKIESQKYAETPLKKTFTLDDGTQIINMEMFTLGTDEEVDYLKLAQQTFENVHNIYWDVNNDDNEINWSVFNYKAKEDITEGTTTYPKGSILTLEQYNALNETNKQKCEVYQSEYILKDGEYIFISDISYSELYDFGSGTRLIKNGSVLQDKLLPRISDITLIYEEGLDSVKSYFKTYNLTSNKLIINEQEIITLTEGDEILAGSGTEIENIYIPNNIFKSMTSAQQKAFKYKIKGETSYNPLPVKPESCSWKIRGLLDINAGPELEQILKYQKIIRSGETYIFAHEITVKLTEYNSSTGEWVEGAEKEIVGSSTKDYTNKFKLSSLIQKSGGEDISLRYIDITSDKKSFIEYPKIFYYASKDVLNLSNYMSINTLNTNYYNVNLTKNTALTLYVPSIPDTENVFMLYIAVDSKLQISLTELEQLSGADVTEAGYLTKGIHIFKVKSGITDFTLTNTDVDNDLKFVMSKIRVKKGYNPYLGLTTAELDPNDNTNCIWKLLNNDSYGNTEAFKICNFLNFKDSTRNIELSDSYPLSSAEAFLDYNNIANKWVIPELDFSTSDITITSKR